MMYRFCNLLMGASKIDFKIAQLHISILHICYTVYVAIIL